jgi:hypothetical protein
VNNSQEKPEDQVIRVRAPAITILEAQLVASTPERVFRWLQDRAVADVASVPATDAALEAALLARTEPLINLGLAEYGIEDETIATVFKSEDPANRRALRLAVLSNQALKRLQAYHMGDLVDALVGRRNSVDEWLKQLSDEELQALFSNPTLSDDFLMNFLEQKKGWAELTDPQHRLAIEALTKNQKMVSRYQSVTMDGYAEYKHGAVFTAAWSLALWSR